MLRAPCASAGGTLTFEDSNMNGMGQSLTATVSTDNFVSPGDDLSFQVLCLAEGLQSLLQGLQPQLQFKTCQAHLLSPSASAVELRGCHLDASAIPGRLIIASPLREAGETQASARGQHRHSTPARRLVSSRKASSLPGWEWDCAGLGSPADMARYLHWTHS